MSIRIYRFRDASLAPVGLIERPGSLAKRLAERCGSALGFRSLLVSLVLQILAQEREVVDQALRDGFLILARKLGCIPAARLGWIKEAGVILGDLEGFPETSDRDEGGMSTGSRLVIDRGCDGTYSG